MFKIKKLIIIVCLLGFILFVSHKDTYKDVSMETIKFELNKGDTITGMEEFTPSEIKKDFGFNINDYGEAAYYGYESIMESNTVLVVKLNSEDSGDSIISAIEDKNSELKKLFSSYAPDQYTMLDNCILEQKGEYIIYIVAEEPKTVEKVVLNCIKG